MPDNYHAEIKDILANFTETLSFILKTCKIAAYKYYTYVVSKQYSILLYWNMPNNDESIAKLPANLTANEISPLLLAVLNDVVYPKQSDIDGSVAKGVFYEY